MTVDSDHAFQEGEIPFKPDIDKIIDELENIPISEPLPLLKESDFNPQYIDAMREIFADFAFKHPQLDLDPENLLKEYIAEYGIVTEQDHFDCLKLALRESLKHIREGKKICIITHNNEYRKRSQRLMSQALYSLLSKIAGRNSVVFIDQTGSSEDAIQKEVQGVMARDGLSGSDYRFLVIDDATYSGVDFYGLIRRVKYNLQTLLEKPEESIDAFVV